jgi:hypothetical protein
MSFKKLRGKNLELRAYQLAARQLEMRIAEYGGFSTGNIEHLRKREEIKIQLMTYQEQMIKKIKQLKATYRKKKST